MAECFDPRKSLLGSKCQLLTICVHLYHRSFWLAVCTSYFYCLIKFMFFLHLLVKHSTVVSKSQGILVTLQAGDTQAYIVYASFFKGQGHQGIFSLVKGTLWGNCKILLEYFKGTKAMTRGEKANAYVASVKYQVWTLVNLNHLRTWGLHGSQGVFPPWRLYFIYAQVFFFLLNPINYIWFTI